MRLNRDQRALLAALDENVPAKTGEVVRKAKAYPRLQSNQASQFALQDLKTMEIRVWVSSRRDPGKPLQWLRTAVGTAYLEATSNIMPERNPR